MSDSENDSNRWWYRVQNSQEIFQGKGIIHRVTCPYTSEKNELVERKHRHVAETSFILLAHASLPLKFWPDAFATTIYSINRLPTKALQDKSPMEVLFNVKPDYRSMRIFGCLCFPHLRPYNSHKLDFRSTQYTFLGYGVNQKG